MPTIMCRRRRKCGSSARWYDRAQSHAAPRTLIACAAAREVDGSASYGSDQTARRHLEYLLAAINVYHGEHTLDVVPKIALPEKRKGRERWLRRLEAARLLGAALGFVWDGEHDKWKRDDAGRLVRRAAWLVARRRPVARFILLRIYSARHGDGSLRSKIALWALSRLSGHRPGGHE